MDIGSGTHYESINCIAYHGVTLRYEDDDGVPFYAPFDAVTREQMASFIARMMERGEHDLPSGDAEPFDGTYGAREAVTREQMASFLARAMDHLATEGMYEDEVTPLPGAPSTDERGEQPFVVGHVDGNVVIDVFHAG